MEKKSKNKFNIFILTTFVLAITLIFSLNNSKVIVAEVETNVATISEAAIELEIKEEKFSDIELGQIVEFGKFYSTIKDGIAVKDDIKWIVLDIVDDSALLMSCDILKTLPYHEYWNATTWETCTLRKWLNNDFYDLAFDDFEKEYIKMVKLPNIGNELSGIVQDFITNDRVFLLSVGEVRKYFDQYTSLMMTKGTEYAKDEGLWVSKYNSSVGYSVWWLRSPGKVNSYASLVHAGGSIGANGDGVATKGNGIRPCIWVKVK